MHARRVGAITAIAAMFGSIGLAQDAPAVRDELRHRSSYFVRRSYVVGERECCAALGRSKAHIVLKRSFEPRPEHQSVHLIEDDLVILEYR